MVSLIEENFILSLPQCFHTGHSLKEMYNEVMRKDKIQ